MTWAAAQNDHLQVSVSLYSGATPKRERDRASNAVASITGGSYTQGDGGLVIIKTLSELAEPDKASLAIRPLDIDPKRIAEGVAEYRQSLVASFELVDDVPESTRSSYERVQNIYSYGILSYDLYTVAGNQARLVVEQALRERFLPFYGGIVTFVDGAGREHEVTAQRFSELHDRAHPLVKDSWKLKLRSGRQPIWFNGMLASLLNWARGEGLLGGQRDRWQDRFRVAFRNYTAHSEYHRELPDDAASEIFHLCELINQLWDTPRSTTVAREVIAIAWTDTAITYGLAEGFQIHGRLPADARCVIVLADPRDRTIGNSFDSQYEMTARPCEHLWGPGAWPDAAQWLECESPSGDEAATLDRLFLLRYHDRRLYMPRSIRVSAALEGEERAGTWYLIRADYPYDAFGHERQVLGGAQRHNSDGFCRECPAETIAEGTWQEMIGYCATTGEDVTPLPTPDIRNPLCNIPRWNQLTKDGQWVFNTELP